jgi:hypothetical protein
MKANYGFKKNISAKLPLLLKIDFYLYFLH